MIVKIRAKKEEGKTIVQVKKFKDYTKMLKIILLFFLSKTTTFIGKNPKRIQEIKKKEKEKNPLEMEFS